LVSPNKTPPFIPQTHWSIFHPIIMFKKLFNDSPAFMRNNGTGFSVLLSYANGIVFGAGLMLFLFTNFFDFGVVLCFVSFFHFWEYMFVAIFRHNELTYNSFLFNHSKEYFYAFVTGFGEYFVECYFFPGMKRWKYFVYPGILIMFIGQTIRTVSMFFLIFFNFQKVHRSFQFQPPNRRRNKKRP
jgi:hypothetical protein